MTQPLILHYAPDNASLVVRLGLEELQLKYSTRLVDRAMTAQKSDAYLKLNPAGLIPVLETPDGTIWETAAILLWLCDRSSADGKGAGPALAPAPSDTRRGRFLSWLFFLSNTLHADLRLTFYPGQYAGPDREVHRTLRAGVRQRLLRHFSILNDAVQDGDVAWDAPPGVLDFYLGACLRWAALYPAGDTGWFDLSAFAALARRAETLESRASVRAVARAEGLGPRPFTAPVAANPPEGTPI